LEEFPLERELFRKEGKDLVVLHLEDEEYFEYRLQQHWNIELNPLELAITEEIKDKSVPFNFSFFSKSNKKNHHEFVSNYMIREMWILTFTNIHSEGLDYWSRFHCESNDAR
jgi:hypothetical protein